MDEKSKTSKAFEHYKILQKQLEVLIDEGKDDSVEAEDLRNEMDFCWRYLSSSERQELNLFVNFPK